MRHRFSLSSGLLAVWMLPVLPGCSLEPRSEVVETVQQRHWTNAWDAVPGATAYGVAATVWGGTFLDVYFRGPGYNIYATWYDSGSGTWATPFSLGAGRTLHPPTVFAKSDGWEHIFYRAYPLGHLMHRWYDGNAYGGPEDLGTVIYSAPAAVDWYNTYADVFYMGSDGNLKHRWSVYVDGQTSGWSSEEDFGVSMTSGPAAVFNPYYGDPREMIFYRSSSGGIDYMSYNGSLTGPYTFVADANMKTNTQPAAAVLGNSTYVFWTDANNNPMWISTVSPTPQIVGDAAITIAGSPAAAAWGDYSIDLLGSLSGTYALQHRVWEQQIDVPLYGQQYPTWCWAGCGQMLAAYYDREFSQCSQANYAFGKTVCCESPLPTECDRGSNTPWAYLGLNYENVFPHLSQAQIEAEVAAGRPWENMANGHGVVGVDRLIYLNTFWVAINDPWPPNVGDQYMETYAAYDGRDGNDVYHIYPL
jgi:hypothetical protein